jgi:hypothetical protein
MIGRVAPCLAAILLLWNAGGAFAQKKPTPTPAPLPPPSNGNEIMPPFSLVWHEPSERLEAKVEAAKLNVVERRKINNRWAVTVTGFKKPNPNDPKAPKPPELRRVMFYFVAGELSRDKTSVGGAKERLAGGQLVEVELQYEQEGWDEDRYGVCLGEKRQMLERLYGQGQQLVRTTTPTPDGQASQTLVGYKWNKNNTAVELIYFHVIANSNDQQFHTLSLHYKRS